MPVFKDVRCTNIFLQLSPTYNKKDFILSNSLETTSAQKYVHKIYTFWSQKLLQSGSESSKHDTVKDTEITGVLSPRMLFLSGHHRLKKKIE